MDQVYNDGWIILVMIECTLIGPLFCFRCLLYLTKL